MKKICQLIFINLLYLGSITGQPKQPVDYVDVFIGTSNSRWVMTPGAMLPFGMVNLSPDNQGTVWCGGYEYFVGSISGFSHIHSMSMGGLSIMPTTGDIKTFPGGADSPYAYMWTAGYRSRYLKQDENAKPGYYSVKLLDYNVKAELSATTHCGFLKFTFPENKNSHILLDLVFPMEEVHTLLETKVTKVSNSEIEGYTKFKTNYADEYIVHFVACFSKPFSKLNSWESDKYIGSFTNYGTDWQEPTVLKQDIQKFESNKDCGVWVDYETKENEVISVKTGISLVSIEQARLNLDNELNKFGWDFESVVINAQKVWNNLLTRIKVDGDTEQDKVKFYTSLYRTYAGRHTMSDVNGKYVDMCEKVQQCKPPVNAVYASDGFWGAQWNLFPLWTLITPDLANSWVNSFIELSDKGGFIPKAPSGIEYGEIMEGEHEIVLISSCYQKGIRNFDVEKAFQAAKHNLTVPGKKHECGGWAGNKFLEPYMQLGYVPHESGAVSNTLEYSYIDWSLAQFAKALSKKEDYKYFMKRSENYKNVFDTASKFFRVRYKDGKWLEDFDIFKYGTGGSWYGSGYMEGNAYQYSFWAPHDVAGLIKLMGKDLFNKRLEEGLEKNLFDMGNQPNLDIPFLFNYSGKPWLTQKYTRHYITKMFDATPWGWIGEEDEGQLSAAFVLSSIGLFQTNGGASEKPFYEISSPIFDTITIQLDPTYYQGKTFKIICKNNGKENVYIQSAILNGKPLSKPWFYHSELVAGGDLVLEMGPTPNLNWGSKEKDAPP